MAFIEVHGTVVQAEYKATRDGQAIENILHWAAPGAQPAASTAKYDSDVMDQALINAFTANIIPQMLGTYRLDEVVLRHITEIHWGAQKGEYTFTEARVSKYAVGVAGGKGFISDPLSTFNSVGTQKVTNDASKFARGSIRLDGLREEDVNVSLIDGLQVGLYQSALEDYGADIPIPNDLPGVDNWSCVVFSRTKGFTPGSTIFDPGETNVAKIVEWRTSNFVTSQVSRKRRKGGA